MFFDKNKTVLKNFSVMSKTAGSRSDYVQGGGGNTSAKLADGLMAIKASGFCLSDIEPDKAYAVIDYEALRGFFYDNNPSDFDNVEKSGAAFVKEHTIHIEGLDSLRPSVEAGFHSILSTYVLHTHSVYANLATCSTSCREIAAKAFDGADYSWGWVPYTDPGSNLTFAIRDEMRRVEKETGKVPSVILMQNHGIIVHNDSHEQCLAINSDANERLANQFGLTGKSFPEVKIKEIGDNLFTTDIPYLADALKSGILTYSSLIETPLYPDQMVFLIGTLYENKEVLSDGEASVCFEKGTLNFCMNEKKAKVIAETLTAIAFITDHISKNGYELSTMGDAAKNFIANWESEKYRKSLAGKK